MASFKILLSSICLALFYTYTSNAAPQLPSAKHSTHQLRFISRDLQVETYHPPSTFEAGFIEFYVGLQTDVLQTFGSGLDPAPVNRGPFDLRGAAVAFAGSRLSVDTAAITFKSGFSGEVAQHAFLKQTQNGIPFANAVANVAFNRDNKVVSFGSSFVKPKNVASSKPTISVATAIANAEKALDGQYNNWTPSLEFFVKPDNSVVLTHVVQIENASTGAWFEAFIDAHTGDLVSVTDFVTKASYRVIPITKQSVDDGFETLTDPHDLTSSPFGWHSTGTTNTTTTSGNNVIAFKGTQTNTSSQTSAGLNFIYTQNPSTAPTTAVNVNTARVNAFYVVNTLHDLTYRYGFTEAAFNFQTNNNGKGGKASDAVTVSVQDSAGFNNADFTTPPDGQPGRMRMFLFDLTTPGRDGALENDIVIHEFTHGVTNRMTGGGTGRCLQTTEAGGMGEGWSDTMSNWNAKTNGDVPDFVTGEYVLDDPAGVRSFPYSTNATVNPLRYSSLQTRFEVHDIGEVWANILHNVYAALVGARGWTPASRTNPAGLEGNIVFLHLFIDALPLQPCNPTFLTARDAWIQADVNRYNGASKCTLWKAFASRGLGLNAANFKDDASVPEGC